MKKKLITSSVLLLTFLLLIYFYLRKHEDYKYVKEGSILIEKVEKYKKEHGKLPESVKDLGLIPEMDEGPYYKKTDSSNYIIYFNIGLDNDQFIYYSKSKRWKHTTSIN